MLPEDIVADLRVLPVVVDLTEEPPARAVVGDTAPAMSIETSALSWSSLVTAIR